MFLHIAFKNGSNPYVKYGTKKELDKEIKKWKKNYILSIENILIDGKNTGYSVIAEDKNKTIIKLSELEIDLIPLF